MGARKEGKTKVRWATQAAPFHTFQAKQADHLNVSPVTLMRVANSSCFKVKVVVMVT